MGSVSNIIWAHGINRRPITIIGIVAGIFSLMEDFSKIRLKEYDGRGQFEDFLRSLGRKVIAALFQRSMDRHRSRVYNYLLKILKSPELADHRAQAIFIKLLDKRKEPLPLLSVMAYLLTMAKNFAYNFLKGAGVDQNDRAGLLKYSPTEGNSLKKALRYAD